MNTSLFIHVDDPDYKHPLSAVTTTSTDPDDPDRPCLYLGSDENGKVVAEEMPWELMEDPDEDQHVVDLRAELAAKQRRLLINIIGTSAYVGGAAIGCALGEMGWVVVTLMTIGLFCMDRK